MMKEKLCFVGYNIEQEQKLSNETTFLVESYTVKHSDPQILCPEICSDANAKVQRLAKMMESPRFDTLSIERFSST